MAEGLAPYNFDRTFVQEDRRQPTSFGGRRKSDRSEHALDAEALRAEIEMLREQQQAELVRTREEAFQAGLDHARADREAAVLSSIDALQATLEELARNRETMLSEFTQDAAELAIAAADAIAGHATGIAPDKTVSDAIGRVLAQIARGEEIQVAVHPDLIESLRAKIDERQADNRKNIAISLNPDASVAAGDAVLTWDRGGVSINAEARRAAITAELEPLLAGSEG
ncbi:FliH/SctL family protein [Erythrobacter aureus]|uniref:Flagellar assembly protein FliH n=1 Tax=Erythrobacter aureus TaxID=2182384 RepID=A0A345YJP7_9SPHN|nr:FliH/SctL family protein [Erythrobacter aureus]AXK44149.1 flagellar assembly protein FliH [Erythrobacter aureus]